ncbi:MAG: DUF1266 domain-containing protein [Defluviitaleaceae bacterium]|nr:DUF1266 domain-containing protein [Defluviitaleaceae bacterium]
MNDNNNDRLLRGGDHMASLFSGATREFETKNSVSEERRRQLAFGSILMHRFGESSRVFKLSSGLPLNELMSLLYRYKIDDSEDARKMVKKLSQADYFTPLANEVFDYFVKTDKLKPLSLGDLPKSIVGLEHTWEFSLQETIPTTEQYIKLNPVAPHEDTTFVWHVYAQKYMVAHLNDCIDAYKENIRFFDEQSIFTAEELANVTDFSAYDLGRVAYISKLNFHLGYLDEKDAWDYIETAAKTASEKYENWRQYLCAYIMGRSLSAGKDATDFGGALSFLLEDEESPLKDISFR